MKRILITGKNSYIGKSLENWIMKQPEKYLIDTIDLRNDSWKNKNFIIYDVVVHVAGIAHIKENTKNEPLYYKVNRDLTFEIAEKAKNDGVSHFIFLSSMSVYGIDTGTISKNTIPYPKSAYGKSKLEAEKLIVSLENANFVVSIIRPPMVYGENCKGNYVKLSKLAKRSVIFPKIDNQRSMIYIYNLTEFIKNLIDNRSRGYFYPQNEEYVNTSDLVKLIAELNGNKMLFFRGLNNITKYLNIKIINKIFGSLIYEMELSEGLDNYAKINFEQSIKQTEGEYNEVTHD